MDGLYPGNVARVRVDAVLDKLIDAGLLRRTGGETQIEVSHEALIRNWPQLMRWLEEERERLRGRFLLRDRAKAWAAARRDPASLLRGRELEEAQRI